jgi:signal recognition particle subunit SRP54
MFKFKGWSQDYMFENLSQKLNRTFKTLKGHGKLSETNIQDALKEVRLALLEADVNYRIVKDFIEDVRQRALGQEVMDSLTPGQQVVKIVNDELTRLMGGSGQDLELSGQTPLAIMLVGLQGSGKTTTAAKLALHIRKQGRNPCLVPADIYRPAAVEQLKKLGAQIHIPVYVSDHGMKPEEICVGALSKAGEYASDVLIMDTAGRLHINEQLMGELVRIKNRINPSEILFVADSMTGQDAVNMAKQFDQTLDITGIILTKMEGDSRGGAALSIKAVTGKPIKFIGVGEQLDGLEPFFPDRMASRILGMGDMISLIERAQEEFDQKEALNLEKKIKKRDFDLEDFQKQLIQIKKLGSLDKIISMLPGTGQLNMKGFKPDETELVKVEAIINSMTRKERSNYRIINGSRRKRIARGSGTSVQDVNRLLKNFSRTKKVMEQLTGKGLRSLPSLFN